MIYGNRVWPYASHHPYVYARNEVCTLDVIDGCSIRFPNNPKAQGACKEGARDSYLFSDMGRSRAIDSGQMEAYAVGHHSTSVLCGGPHSRYAPFVGWW